METMFSYMMEGCMKSMSEEDKKKMRACGLKIAELFSSTGMKEMTEDRRKAMREKIMACCGSKMEKMSACFKKTDSTSDQACCAEKA